MEESVRGMDEGQLVQQDRERAVGGGEGVEGVEGGRRVRYRWRGLTTERSCPDRDE